MAAPRASSSSSAVGRAAVRSVSSSSRGRLNAAREGACATCGGRRAASTASEAQTPVRTEARYQPHIQFRAPRRPANTARRHLATVANTTHKSQPETGPIAEYNARVDAGKLRDDQHQRALIQALQDLHEELVKYVPPAVHIPDVASLRPDDEESKGGFLASLFHRKPSKTAALATIPDNLPKGLYMHGDVGSGKTMLMDLFYDTLPPNIAAKTRIHFHNFMQDVHKRLHKLRTQHGHDADVMPIVAAQIAAEASVLCFDEFQVTDIADAMILRRLVELLLRNGCVIVTTSNRHPRDLYKNGIQRQSFVPCINLLLTHLAVLNLDSTTDYRKIPRPPSGVYHHPDTDRAAVSHADKWFNFLGDPEGDPPHAATQTVWGRDIHVPRASGRCAAFTFDELIGRATGAADYLELVRAYDAFVVTHVPQMTLRQRDWARRFITFIDAVYEGRAKLVLTTAVPLQQLFISRDEMREVLEASAGRADAGDHADVDTSMRMLMDDLGLSMDMLKGSSIFSGDEEAFAFARALSRLQEMGSAEWVERGLGLEARGGKGERDSWQRVRSKWREDSM